jgi:hypothetical protein
MSEQKLSAQLKNLSPVVQKAEEMGMKVGSAAEDARKLQEFRETLPGRDLDESLGPVSERSRERGMRGRLRTKVLSGAIALGAVAGGSAYVAGSTEEKPEPATAEYVVGTDPGIDTPWEMAQSIEAKVDNIKGNQDIRPIVDDIVEQANADGQPGLQVGERIQVPESADAHSGPGIQLSSK